MLHPESQQGSQGMTAETDGLKGAKVLVLEDETLVSMMIEDMLADLGCEVVGPFARLEEALEHISTHDDLDLALLDVNLGGVRSFPAAEALAEAEVPFIFTTGYDDAGIPETWRSRPALRKPFILREMETILRGAIKN